MASQQAVVGIAILCIFLALTMCCSAHMFSKMNGPSPAPAPAPKAKAKKANANVESDEDDPTPTPPSYTLRDAQTPANDWGNGNMIFLDRHTLDCDDDGLNQFRLGRPTGNQIQYKYKCLDGINSTANINKDTGSNDWGGGNTIFLDRHDVNCDKNPIAKFRLARPADDKIRYDYTCNSKKVSGACRNADTGWNEENSMNIYLDRHDVTCNAGEVITQFKLQRDGQGKFRYDYKCCEM